VDSVSKENDEIVLRVCVRDTGVGIAVEQQKTIFNAFCQANGAVGQRYGSMGLGLTISSRLIAMMGGTLTVESEFGKGSAFSFTVSMKRNEL
jgi:signal transduction histidine kinase